MSGIDFTSHTEFLAKLRDAGYNDDIKHLKFDATPNEKGFEGRLTVFALNGQSRQFWVSIPVKGLTPPYEYLFYMTKAFLDEMRVIDGKPVEDNTELSW